MTPLRTIRIVVWVAVAVLVGSLGAIFLLDQKGAVSPITTASIGGPFSLTDQNGNTVTEAALQGHPSALFFGYTYCPDVCPTTLADMTIWLQSLGDAGNKLKVYFVTVDPERDNQETMAAYLEAFDPRITGLTGPRPAIDEMLKAYRVYSRKVPGEDGTYTMDHSASVYLLDSNAKFVSTVDYQEKPETALAKLKRLVGES